MGYPKERKNAVIKKMLPPNQISIRELAKQEGISEATLYIWRNQARQAGRLLPQVHATPTGWSSADKFAAVLETAAMNEAELSAYCRSRGLYAEQIQQWRQACEQANDWDRTQNQRLKSAREEDQRSISWQVGTGSSWRLKTGFVGSSGPEYISPFAQLRTTREA